jgi:hypothetical protein
LDPGCADGASEHQIQTRAARPSIGRHTLASYWHDPSGPCP